jgi:hypothetical protein
MPMVEYKLSKGKFHDFLILFFIHISWNPGSMPTLEKVIIKNPLVIGCAAL